MNYVKCKVVMLPTEKASLIYSIRKNRTEFNLICGGPVPIKRDVHAHGYHLYILSYDKLDYATEKFESGAFYHVDPFGDKHIITKETFKPNPNFCSKIIASTDPELNLPRPSNSFIEKYCQLSGNIDEVMVEQISVGHYESDFYPPLWKETGTKLKVAADNTITIKPVVLKKYTREEVIGFITPLITESCKEKGSSQKEIDSVIEFWININLDGY